MALRTREGEETRWVGWRGAYMGQRMKLNIVTLSLLHTHTQARTHAHTQVYCFVVATKREGYAAHCW